MRMELASNGWSTTAVIKVIGGARPIIIGRDLMTLLGLQLVQRKPGQEVMAIQDVQLEIQDDPERPNDGDPGLPNYDVQLEKWQDYK